MKHSGCLTLKIHRLSLLLYLIITVGDVYGQYFNMGQDPAIIRWRQIQTEHFKIIYPAEFEVKAQYTANVLENVVPLSTHTLNVSPRVIPVILHTSNVEPNAVTGWAPRRMEWFTCPPQDTYAQEWLQQLALHEFRHTLQFGVLNQGFTRALTFIFGEHATAAVTGLFIPNWFLEGDAVCAETAQSHSGRGRVPGFEQGLRAQIIQKGTFSYDKAVFGSFKDYVPNQYDLGYQIVANVRRTYGSKAWEMVLHNVARKPYTLKPFDRALRSVTGMNKIEVYNNTIRFLDSAWRYQQANTSFTRIAPFPVESSGSFKHYKYPQYFSDSLLIAERTSLDDISRFVLIDRKGNETILATPGFFSSASFSLGSAKPEGGLNQPGTFTADNVSISKGLLTWAELKPDPRWAQRNYSVIQLYDIGTGKSRQLTKISRLFAPAISPDATSIAAVRVTRNNISSIVLLDIFTGDVMNVLCSSVDEHYMNPAWSPDGKQLVFTVLNQHGKGVRLLNLNNGRITELVQPGFTEISNPVFAGQYVLYNGAYSGIENIYAVDTSTLARSRVTSSAFGARNAKYNQHLNRLLYAEYTSNGYRPVEAEFKPSAWVPVDQVGNLSPGLYKWLLPQEAGVTDSATIGSTLYKSENYSKARHLLNFHSWAPAYIDFNSSEFSSGVSVMSQNELSTATTVAGYNWDIAEKAGRLKLNFEYSGWYPVIDFGVSTGKRAATETISEAKETRYTWNETELNGGVKVPLFFYHRHSYTFIQPSIHTTYTYITENRSVDTAKVTGSVHTIDYRFFGYNYLKKSSKDIYPRWGQALDLNLRHSPFGNNDLGNILSAEATFFFPGIIKHHGLRVYTALQRRVKSAYQYASLINSPRGYGVFNDKWMYALACTYKFPFWYPDASAGPVVYVKRVKAALFYDLSFTGDYGSFKKYDATGIELTADMHLLRFLFPFDLGLRIGYLPESSKFFTDFLFSVNFAI